MDKILFPVQTGYLKSFKKNDDPLITEIEDYARQNNVPILSWDSAEFLEQLVILKNPKRVLELGTAIGYSSIRMAKHLDKKGVVHTIEKSEENAEKARKYIAKAKLEKKIKILEGNAQDILPNLKKKYDIIFLDADKSDYGILLEQSVKRLRKGGILFVDNLLWHGYAAAENVPPKYKKSAENIREFNKLFTGHSKLITAILPIGDGLGLGIKK